MVLVVCVANWQNVLEQALYHALLATDKGACLRI